MQQNRTFKLWETLDLKGTRKNQKEGFSAGVGENTIMVLVVVVVLVRLVEDPAPSRSGHRTFRKYCYWKT